MKAPKKPSAAETQLLWDKAHKEQDASLESIRQLRDRLAKQYDETALIVKIADRFVYYMTKRIQFARENFLEVNPEAWVQAPDLFKRFFLTIPDTVYLMYLRPNNPYTIDQLIEAQVNHIDKLGQMRWGIGVSEEEYRKYHGGSFLSILADMEGGEDNDETLV